MPESNSYTASFFVPGRPVPQGSKVAFRHNRTGKPMMMEGNRERLNQWRALVAMYARQAGLKPTLYPVRLFVHFYFERPQRHRQKGLVHMPTRPDLDKLTRAVFDALTGVAYRDDSQVVEAHVFKRYTDSVAGASVTLLAGEASPQAAYEVERR